MRLAFAKAGLWFFGSIIFVYMFWTDSLKNTSKADIIFTLLLVGIVAGGTAFFWEWHTIEKEKHELEMQARRRKMNGGTQSEETE